jgi:hypothetical protein
MVDVLKFNSETEKYQKIILKKGQSGFDDCSSMCCPQCYSEPGDYGIVYNFDWQDPAGWKMSGPCGTCGFYETKFVPYEEEE